MRFIHIIAAAVRAARFIEVLSSVNSIECDLCKCTDRFWPNCTAVCQQNTNRSFPALNRILLEISPSCQVFVDITIAQTLESDEWCQSTTKDRKGYVIQTPSTSLDGYNMVRGRLLDRYVSLKGDGFACASLTDGEGYVTYPSLFAPSKSFCPIMALPEARALQNLTKNSDSISIPMMPYSRADAVLQATRDDLGSTQFYNSDELQPYTLRHIRVGEDAADCYGALSEVNITRRIAGFINGRSYNSFGATARADEDIDALTRVLPNVTTNDKIARPHGSSIWDSEDFRNAPGFDLIEW